MEDRYCRQEPMLGKDGQKRLLESSVAVVGCGGLGSVAAELLARAGVGSLLLVDDDCIDITNLQRQALYRESDLSKCKSSCLKGHIASINSEVNVAIHDKRLTPENISNILRDVDVILDCTDKVDSRRVINRFAVGSGIPWVHGAAVQSKGELLNIVPGGPCFECIFPNVSQAPSCAVVGILNSSPHVTASLQVVEALKLLLGRPHEKDLLRIDVYDHSIDRIRVRRDPGCSVCGGLAHV